MAVCFTACSVTFIVDGPANPITYTVIYDSQSADTTANPASEMVAAGAALTSLPIAPVKTNFIFGGWFTAIDGGGTQFKTGAIITNDITVYANWVINQYTVSFDSQGADTAASPASMLAAEGAALPSLPTAPVKANFSFGGWFTAVSGGGTEFNTATIITNDFTVYAKWNSLTYTVTYNGNGNDTGTVPIDSNSYINGQFVTVTGNTGNLAKTNVDGLILNFMGWTNSSGVTFVNNSSFNIGPQNIILYAKWSILRSKGPAGGLIFYDKGYYSGTPSWRYLEVATNDQHGYGPIVLANQWIEGGNTQTTKNNNTSTDIGTGLDNSIAITNQAGHTDSAAKLCLEYSLTNNGITYDDWFLPSKDELLKVYVNLKKGIDDNGDAYILFDGFHLNLGAYWSSSENTAYDNICWGVDLRDNDNAWASKNASLAICAVRAF